MVCNCKSPINGQLMYFSEISLKKKKNWHGRNYLKKKRKKKFEKGN